jgi:hypothetical protein
MTYRLTDFKGAGNIPIGKDCGCVELITLTLSWVDCLEIWESETAGDLKFRLTTRAVAQLEMLVSYK